MVLDEPSPTATILIFVIHLSNPSTTRTETPPMLETPGEFISMI